MKKSILALALLSLASYSFAEEMNSDKIVEPAAETTVETTTDAAAMEAAPAKPKMYVGVSLGRSVAESNSGLSNASDALKDQFETITSDLTGSSKSFGFSFGYKINKFFAVELSYVNSLGQSDDATSNGITTVTEYEDANTAAAGNVTNDCATTAAATVQCSTVTTTAAATESIEYTNAFSITAKPGYLIKDKFNLYAKLGYTLSTANYVGDVVSTATASTDVNGTISAGCGVAGVGNDAETACTDALAAGNYTAAIDESESASGFNYGVGFEYLINDKMTVGVEYIKYNLTTSDISSVSIDGVQTDLENVASLDSTNSSLNLTFSYGF